MHADLLLARDGDDQAGEMRLHFGGAAQTSGSSPILPADRIFRLPVGLVAVLAVLLLPSGALAAVGLIEVVGDVLAPTAAAIHFDRIDSV